MPKEGGGIDLGIQSVLRGRLEAVCVEEEAQPQQQQVVVVNVVVRQECYTSS